MVFISFPSPSKPWHHIGVLLPQITTDLTSLHRFGLVHCCELKHCSKNSGDGGAKQQAPNKGIPDRIWQTFGEFLSWVISWSICCLHSFWRITLDYRVETKHESFSQRKNTALQISNLFMGKAVSESYSILMMQFLSIFWATILHPVHGISQIMNGRWSNTQDQSGNQSSPQKMSIGKRNHGLPTSKFRGKLTVRSTEWCIWMYSVSAVQCWSLKWKKLQAIKLAKGHDVKCTLEPVVLSAICSGVFPWWTCLSQEWQSPVLWGPLVQSSLLKPDMNIYIICVSMC